jgi:streptomycin 6-kinase
MYPEAFVRNVRGLRGDEGLAWLNNLPYILSKLGESWSIKILPPYNLSYNYVAPAIQADGTPVVVKVGFPRSDVVASEFAALSWMNPEGVCLLLNHAPEYEAILLEQVTPGTLLADLCESGKDDEATRLGAQAMRRIWVPTPNAAEVFPFETTEDWAEGFQRLRERFDEGTGPFPAGLVDEAEGLWHDLTASSAPSVLLHGDCHHDNILQATRAPYLVIDPKGIIGEPAFETGTFLRNPGPFLKTQPDMISITARRIAILSEELGMERERIRGWAVAQAVLSAWWWIEDCPDVTSEELELELQMAEAFRAVRW